MAAPAIIQDLVARFAEYRERHHSGQYDEAQLRQEFLNPFFEALGWDVYNKKGHADAYKEVIHEAAIKIGGRTKAPDYCFRVGGGRSSFFVEAKKPAVDIGVAISPAYQLRRYAWSAKLPISILTDFEELAIYDCRIRPAKTDKPATGRILYCTFEEYLARWDELEALLSPEAIRRGALDRFVASQKVKKGTAEVDTAFLAEIESWRDLLARNTASRNPDLSQRDLNFAVQRTIDRIVFLRICEDRGIEPYGGLQALSNGAGVYGRLTELFQRTDERYNSGLFHFSPEKDRDEPPDELTLRLSIDDKPLKDIIGSLYYPESPYEFSVLPTEILGQVYEQFLGKVIRLTKGHRAKVEEKPEVRKAGGVYYTPTFIVDYIVRHTVGRRLEGKSPAQASKLRVLDPACGSGSFLIGAYQYLLDWHRDTYVADSPEKHARGRNPKLYRGPAMVRTAAAGCRVAAEAECSEDRVSDHRQRMPICDRSAWLFDQRQIVRSPHRRRRLGRPAQFASCEFLLQRGLRCIGGIGGQLPGVPRPVRGPIPHPRRARGPSSPRDAVVTCPEKRGIAPPPGNGADAARANRRRQADRSHRPAD